MSHHDKLTDADWEFLQRALEATTDAVMVAHPGGTWREVLAVVRGWEEASHLFPRNEFVQMLLLVPPDELREMNDREIADAERTSEEILADAELKCRKAMDLLRKKDPADADTYRRIILFLVDKVARASKEGGFFGIGGKRISDSESVAIKRISDALEITFETTG